MQVKRELLPKALQLELLKLYVVLDTQGMDWKMQLKHFLWRHTFWAMLHNFLHQGDANSSKELEESLHSMLVKISGANCEEQLSWLEEIWSN